MMQIPSAGFQGRLRLSLDLDYECKHLVDKYFVPFGDERTQRWNGCWMRTVSFAGLHRMLQAIAEAPGGSLKPKEINRLVHEKQVTLRQGNSIPAPTTLYHYRNTLLRLQAVRREGSMLKVNNDNPHVIELLSEPAPSKEVCTLSDSSKHQFGELVLKNEECRSLFFALFMASGDGPISVRDFRENGLSIIWVRRRIRESSQVVFENVSSGETKRYKSAACINAVLYGLRYWARDELGLLDEFYQRSLGAATMYPLEIAVRGQFRKSGRS